MASIARLNKLNFSKLINFVLFQAIWLACVIGAAKNYMLSAWILFLTLIYWQSCPINRNGKDLLFVIVLLPLGMLLDSLWIFLQIIEYQVALPFSAIAPYWIGMLWVTFALSLNSSMQWLFQYPKLAVAFGCIGGPLSYLAAERIGAIKIHEPITTLPFLALSWAFVILIILLIDKKITATKSNAAKKISHA